MSDGRALFQVAVGEVAVRVSKRCQSMTDGVGQRGAPHHRSRGGGVEDTAQTMAGGVAGPDDGRSVGDDFAEPRWPVGKRFD